MLFNIFVFKNSRNTILEIKAYDSADTIEYDLHSIHVIKENNILKSQKIFLCLTIDRQLFRHSSWNRLLRQIRVSPFLNAFGNFFGSPVLRNAVKLDGLALYAARTALGWASRYRSEGETDFVFESNDLSAMGHTTFRIIGTLRFFVFATCFCIAYDISKTNGLVAAGRFFGFFEIAKRWSFTLIIFG